MNDLSKNEQIEEIKTSESDVAEEVNLFSPAELATKQLLVTVEQLEQVIEEEINALQAQEIPDFNEINNRKIRLLRDIEKRQKNFLQFNKEGKNQEIFDKLEQIKPKLERNQYLIKMHLDAVSELVELLKAKAAALEADGTYKVDDCLT